MKLLHLALPLLLACSPSPSESALTTPLDDTTSATSDRSRAGADQAVFAQHLDTLLEDAPASNVVQGQEAWWFFVPELRSLRAAAIEEPLEPILDFHRQLQERGVELIFAPIPAKAAVYPERLPSAPDFSTSPPHLDTAHDAFLRRLADEDVPVLDLRPLFLEHRDDPEGFLHCRQDTHFSGRGAVLVAEHLAQLIRQRPWFDALPDESYQSEWREVSIRGDLVRDLEEQVAAETLDLHFVGQRQGDALVPLQPDPASPILLLGDSHTLVFQAGGDLHAKGAGLADQLAYELGTPIDLIGVRGSGATSSRVNLLRRGGVEGKKLVIWVLTARELTEGDWKKVPVSR